MGEQLSGRSEARLADIIGIAESLHGADVLYLYPKGDNKAMTIREAIALCGEHMIEATDDQIKEILTIWRQDFVDLVHANFEAARHARYLGKKALDQK